MSRRERKKADNYFQMTLRVNRCGYSFSQSGKLQKEHFREGPVSYISHLLFFGDMYGFPRPRPRCTELTITPAKDKFYAQDLSPNSQTRIGYLRTFSNALFVNIQTSNEHFQSLLTIASAGKIRNISLTGCKLERSHADITHLEFDTFTPIQDLIELP